MIVQFICKLDLGQEMPQCADKYCSGYACESVSGEINTGISKLSKAGCLSGMNFTQLTEGLNRIMRLTDPLSSKRDLS